MEQLHSAGALELHLLALPLSTLRDKQTNACCGPFDPLANPATLLPAKSPQSSQSCSYQRHLSSVYCMALKHICICLEEGGQCRPVCFLRKGDLDGLGEGGKTTDCFIERSNPRLPPRPSHCTALQRCFGRH